MPPPTTTSKKKSAPKTKAPPKTVAKTAAKPTKTAAKPTKTTVTSKPKAVPKTVPVAQPVLEPVVAATAPVVTEAPVTTEAPVVSDTPYLEEFSAVVTELDSALTLIRNLKTRIQKLEKQVHRDHKVLLKKANGKRARKPRDPNAPKSGFAKEGPVSTEMGKFLGLKKDELISRTDVTKKIHEYCKAKDLQDPADKRHIKPDASLRKLLKMNKDDDLTFFNLQKYMKVHFPNKEGVYPTL
jgi:chromatin remodeling complex protein RSC6